MELNINELTSSHDEMFYNDDLYDYNNVLEQQQQIQYEKIPENTVTPVPIKVIKKGVHFADPDQSQKPMHQTIPKVNAKIVRPKIPQQKSKISYEDILSKMGMFVSDGKLHLVDRNTLTPQQQQQYSQQYSQQYQEPLNIPNNSFIYNKYFKEEIQEPNIIRKPKTIQEYKQMIINDYIERQRIKQMKSTKLIMPTSNIHFSPVNSGNYSNLPNKLFSFPKR